jgi:hypothetical protein
MIERSGHNNIKAVTLHEDMGEVFLRKPCNSIGAHWVELRLFFQRQVNSIYVAVFLGGAHGKDSATTVNLANGFDQVQKYVGIVLEAFHWP